MQNREGMSYTPDAEKDEKQKEKIKARPGGFMKKASRLFGAAALGAATLGSPAEAESPEQLQTELAEDEKGEKPVGEYFVLGNRIDIIPSKPTESVEAKEDGYITDENKALEICKEFGLIWNQARATLTLPTGEVIDFRRIDEIGPNDPGIPGNLKVTLERKGGKFFITYYQKGIKKEHVVG